MVEKLPPSTIPTSDIFIPSCCLSLSSTINFISLSHLSSLLFFPHHLHRRPRPLPLGNSLSIRCWLSILITDSTSPLSSHPPHNSQSLRGGEGQHHQQHLGLSSVRGRAGQHNIITRVTKFILRPLSSEQWSQAVEIREPSWLRELQLFSEGRWMTNCGEGGKSLVKREDLGHHHHELNMGEAERQ